MRPVHFYPSKRAGKCSLLAIASQTVSADYWIAPILQKNTADHAIRKLSPIPTLTRIPYPDTASPFPTPFTLLWSEQEVKL